MRNTLVIFASVLILVFGNALVIADDLTLPNTFTADTKAKASEVNANFDAVETEVDDNATDIATNAADIATNTANITTNTADIATNVTDIATNTADTATNTTDIATLQTQVATLPTNNLQTLHVMFGGNAGETRYANVKGGSDEEGRATAVMPKAGKLKYMYIRPLLLPNPGTIVTLTARINGIDTALTVTHDATTDLGNFKSNTTDEVQVAETDLFTFKSVESGGIMPGTMYYCTVIFEFD